MQYFHSPALLPKFLLQIESYFFCCFFIIFSCFHHLPADHNSRLANAKNFGMKVALNDRSRKIMLNKQSVLTLAMVTL